MTKPLVIILFSMVVLALLIIINARADMSGTGGGTGGAGGTGDISSVGVNPPLTGGAASGDVTISCQTATASTPGCLLSTDWVIFNAKQNALTTSASLGASLNDETGSGLVVFNTSPTLIAPAISDFTSAQHSHASPAQGGALAIGGPPTGPAGGALSGAYPSPSIANDAVALGTMTTGNYVATITGCTPGEGVTCTPLMSGAAASGDLSGTYPSPAIAPNAVALTTDTIGDYVATITAGPATSVSCAPGEGVACTVGSTTSGAKYILQQPDAGLSAAQALSLLSTGLVMNTTTTGALSTWAGASCTAMFPRALSGAGVPSCAKVTLGDLDFTPITTASTATGDLSGTFPNLIIGPNTVALTTDTTGNYVASITGCTAGEGVTCSPLMPGATAGGDLSGTFPSPTIAPNAVGLGTDTTGDYVASITGCTTGEGVTCAPIMPGTSASGALAGTYPSPTIAANAVPLGTATSGNYVAEIVGCTPGEGVICTVSGGAAGAPTDATYITATPHAALSAEQALSALPTGLMLNTTATGVVSIYTGTSCTNQFPRSLSVSGAASCASVALSDLNFTPLLSGTTAGGALSGTYPSPTIASDAVALGTNTIGDYVASISGCTPGEGTNCTIALPITEQENCSTWISKTSQCRQTTDGILYESRDGIQGTVVGSVIPPHGLEANKAVKRFITSAESVGTAVCVCDSNSVDCTGYAMQCLYTQGGLSRHEHYNAAGVRVSASTEVAPGSDHTVFRSLEPFPVTRVRDDANIFDAQRITSDYNGAKIEATTGFISVANDEVALAWRNATNSADLGIKVDAANVMQLPTSIAVSGNVNTSGYVRGMTRIAGPLGTPFTVTTSECGEMLLMTTGTGAVSLPADPSSADGTAGCLLCFYQVVADDLLFDPSGSDIIDASAAGLTLAAGDRLQLASGQGNQLCLLGINLTTWILLPGVGTLTDAN